MRSIKAAVVLAALSVVLLATTGVGAFGDLTHQKDHRLPVGCHRLVTAQDFVPFSERVWQPAKWRRGMPSEKVLQAQRHKLHCAKSPSHQKAMQANWRRDKKVFFHYRRVSLEWQGCPDNIKRAATHYRVMGWLLYGIEGAESTWGAGGPNLFGLLAGAEGVDVTDPYAAAMQSSRLMRRLKDEYGDWDSAMLAYSGGGYDTSHPRALNAGVCP